MKGTILLINLFFYRDLMIWLLLVLVLLLFHHPSLAYVYVYMYVHVYVYVYVYVHTQYTATAHRNEFSSNIVYCASSIPYHGVSVVGKCVHMHKCV